MEWYEVGGRGAGMQLEDIQIISGDSQVPFHPIGPVSAHASALTVFSPPPTLSTVHEGLREEALRVGANAVVNVTYERGMSLTSWKTLTATGLAVVLADDTRICPACAETIKAAAKVCRYCGLDLSGNHGDEAMKQ